MSRRVGCVRCKRALSVHIKTNTEQSLKHHKLIGSQSASIARSVEHDKFPFRPSWASSLMIVIWTKLPVLDEPLLLHLDSPIYYIQLLTWHLWNFSCLFFRKNETFVNSYFNDGFYTLGFFGGVGIIHFRLCPQNTS